MFFKSLPCVLFLLVFMGTYYGLKAEESSSLLDSEQSLENTENLTKVSENIRKIQALISEKQYKEADVLLSDILKMKRLSSEDKQGLMFSLGTKIKLALGTVEDAIAYLEEAKKIASNNEALILDIDLVLWDLKVKKVLAKKKITSEDEEVILEYQEMNFRSIEREVKALISKKALQQAEDYVIREVDNPQFQSQFKQLLMMRFLFLIVMLRQDEERGIALLTEIKKLDPNNKIIVKEADEIIVAFQKDKEAMIQSWRAQVKKILANAEKSSDREREGEAMMKEIFQKLGPVVKPMNVLIQKGDYKQAHIEFQKALNNAELDYRVKELLVIGTAPQIFEPLQDYDSLEKLLSRTKNHPDCSPSVRTYIIQMLDKYRQQGKMKLVPEADTQEDKGSFLPEAKATEDRLISEMTKPSIPEEYQETFFTLCQRLVPFIPKDEFGKSNAQTEKRLQESA